jgi:hypothetical protein
VLAEQEPAGHRRDGGLQAEQDAEDALRRAAHRRQFQGVGHDRGQHRHAGGQQHQVRVPRDVRRAARAERQEDHGARRHRHREAAAAGHGGARAGTRDDIHGPERGGDQGERHARQAERSARRRAVALGEAKDGHARHGQQDPAEVTHAAGQRGGEGERAEELNGHRRAQGEPGESGVEEHVGSGEADAVEQHRLPLTPPPAADPGAGGGEQRDRGQAETQQGRTGRAENREQAHRERRTDLERGAGAEHKQDRRPGRPPWPPGRDQ